MGLFGFLKQKKKAEQRQETKEKPAKQEKQEKVQIIQEYPVVTMAREVMNMRYFLEDMKRAMHDDHHRIIDEFSYLPKRDDLKEALGEKIEKLKAEQLRIAREIEVTQFQRGILDILDSPKSAQDVANELGRSRTWVSQQISTLHKAGFVKKEQTGKRITYKAFDAGESIGENTVNAPSQDKPTVNTGSQGL